MAWHIRKEREKQMKYIVTYKGWFGVPITRPFDTHARAVQWASQCGVFSIATITEGKSK